MRDQVHPALLDSHQGYQGRLCSRALATGLPHTPRGLSAAMLPPGLWVSGWLWAPSSLPPAHTSGLTIPDVEFILVTDAQVCVHETPIVEGLS